jgi:translation elongation factor EF-1alpha
MTDSAEEREKQIEELLSSFYEKVRETGISKSLLDEKGTRNKVCAILWKTKNELELLRKVDNVNWARKKIEQIENDISTLLEICGKPGAFNK